METTFTVEYDPLFSARVPHTRTLLIEADVNDTPTSDQQKQEIGRLASEIAGTVAVDRINSVPAIAATRAAYKACGKDPNRYRPSQEQLMRRIVRGLGLYNVSSLVDGRTLTLGIGREGEPYTGIGRGELNIAGLPVFRDATGGIGTPTSDNERTRITPATVRLLVTVHLFDTGADPETILRHFTTLFTRYGAARNIRHALFAPQTANP